MPFTLGQQRALWFLNLKIGTSGRITQEILVRQAEFYTVLLDFA
jgi:hypothetical protein